MTVNGNVMSSEKTAFRYIAAKYFCFLITGKELLAQFETQE